MKCRRGIDDFFWFCTIKIIYKVLIIVHTLIRQGNGDQTLSRLQKHTEVLSLQRLKEKASGK